VIFTQIDILYYISNTEDAHFNYIPKMPSTMILIDVRNIDRTSNGNASETKANESFDNGVFFDIEAKRTPSTVRKLFSKRSEHIR